jgi:hypothetical protein
MPTIDPKLVTTTFELPGYRTVKNQRSRGGRHQVLAYGTAVVVEAIET